MRKALMILAIIACPLALSAQAESPASLYEKVASATAYVAHEIYLDPALCKNPGLFRKWEESRKTSLLSAYFPLSSGSAFLVGTEGVLLTNRHVVEPGKIDELRAQAANAFAKSVADSAAKGFTADEIKILKVDAYAMLSKGAYRFSALVGGKTYVTPVRVAVAGGEEPDIAVLRLPAGSYPGLDVAGEEAIAALRVGSEVMSFGFPLGGSLGSESKDRIVTMNKGSVSALRKTDLGIQHSAAISPGNSGGPLVDSTGLVLGMNTASMAAGNSLYLAVGADRLRSFLLARNIVLAKPAAASAPRAPAESPTTPTVPGTTTGAPAAAGAAVPPPGPATNILGEIEVSADVLVDSEKGAQVLVDGKPAGIAPLFLTLTAPVTRIEVKGQGGEYGATLRLLSSLRGSTLLRAPLTPPPRKGTILVSADGDVLKVLLDGRELGPLGPGIFPDIAEGEHDLELVGRDLHYEARIQVPGEERLQIAARLTPFGTLALAAPAGVVASVRGGGLERGLAAGGRPLRLPPGDYAVSASGGPYPVSGRVSVARGETTRWEPFSTGQIGFAVTPKDARVRIAGGEEKGIDADLGGLAPGSYDLLLGKPGFKEQKVTVKVAAGVRTLVTANLVSTKPGTLILPAYAIPLDLTIEGARLEGSPGADGTVAYAGVPAGYQVKVGFESPYAKALGLAGIELRLAEDELRTLDLPSGRLSLPWIPKGALVKLRVLNWEKELRNGGTLGFLSEPLPPGDYEVIIEGEGATDFEAMPVTIGAGAPTEPPDFRNRMGRSLSVRKETLEAEYGSHRRGTTLRVGGFAAGILGLVGTVVFYTAGSGAYEAYNAATDWDTVAELRSKVTLYSGLTLASGAIGIVGTVFAPNFKEMKAKRLSLEEAIAELDAGIKALTP